MFLVHSWYWNVFPNTHAFSKFLWTRDTNKQRNLRVIPERTGIVSKWFHWFPWFPGTSSKQICSFAVPSFGPCHDHPFLPGTPSRRTSLRVGARSSELLSWSFRNMVGQPTGKKRGNPSFVGGWGCTQTIHIHPFEGLRHDRCESNWTRQSYHCDKLSQHLQ